jgi:hypothetical protein
MSAERPPLLELLQQAVPLLLTDLEAQGQSLDEQLYLQLARVAGIMGEPDKVTLHILYQYIILNAAVAVPAAGEGCRHHGAA